MKDFLLHPATLGAGCVLLTVLLVLSLYHLLRVKGEYARYRRMLSDKMEIDAAAVSKQKGELDALRKENENLRIKVQTLNAQPEQKLAREVEIFARAEKKMTVAAPGFASPWEQAKQAAWQELSEEESGKTGPRTLFQRFFGGSGSEQVPSLPQASETPKQPAQAGGG
jgi:cell division protein FtsB